MSLTLKITSLAVRTLAKPIANAIKRNAHEHEKFRKICVGFAQSLHRVDMRMRLGLLQDPAVIDRQIKKEVAAAEAARKKAAIPTVKTEAETKAEEEMSEKEKEAIKKRAEERSRPRIRPLSETRAIELGANFVSETFIFAVAVGVLVFEQWRQRRKAKDARDENRELIEKLETKTTTLENKLEKTEAELAEMKARYEPTSSKLLGLWPRRGNSDARKPEEKSAHPPPDSETSSSSQRPASRKEIQIDEKPAKEQPEE